MDLAFSPEQDELRSSIRAVLDRECPVGVVRALAEHGTAPESLWRTQTELGWPALAVAEAAGGIGGAPSDLVVLCEELGRHVAPGPLLATLQYAVVVSAAGGHPSLAAIAEGAATGTVAATAYADRWPLDEGVVSGGSAEQVLDATTATWLAVVAPDHEVSVVAAEGLERSALRLVDETRALGRVSLASAAPDQVGAVAHGLDFATVLLAAESVGVASALLDLVIEHAKSRQQFGVPIGSFQAVKHKLADCYVALERARATTYAAAAALDEGANEAIATYASAAKVAVGDMQERVAGDAIQLLGGVGYTWEHDAHLYAKRLKSASGLFGSAREHRKRLATTLGL